jgi:hypothetical protein
MLIEAPRDRVAILVLRLAGTAVLLLSAILLVVLPSRPVHQNVPGFQNPVVGFELASTPEHVFGILGGPDDPARDETVRRMNRGNRIDFLFLLAYPAFYVGIALLLAAHGTASRGVTLAVLVLAGAMAFGDALENRELLRLAGITDPAAMLPALSRLRVFTSIKWAAIYAASALVAACIWRERGWWRWSAPFFALAAILGACSVVYLPALEIGSMVLVVAWIMTYIRAFR